MGLVMKQKKNTKILMILIILALIVILVAGGIYIYLATDLFRNNKDIFNDTLIKIGNEKKLSV